MSVKIMGKVWELELPHNKLIVLLAMADHADHEGKNVFPSQGLIAWKTGYSVRQIRSIVLELVKDGVLKEVSRQGGKAVRYEIDLTNAKQKPAYTPEKTSARKKLPPGKIVPSTPEISSDDLGKNSLKTADEPSIESSIETTTKGVGDVFRFYEDMVGSMTGYMIDVLKEAIADYSAEWLIDAMKIAIEQNKRNWKYTEGILKKWKQNGKDTKSSSAKKSGANISSIRSDVYYVEETHETMIFDWEKGKWDKYPGKLESRPA